MNYTSNILLAEIWLQLLHVECIPCPVCTGIKAIDRTDTHNVCCGGKVNIETQQAAGNEQNMNCK
jgi:hypothetical protein